MNFGIAFVAAGTAIAGLAAFAPARVYADRLAEKDIVDTAIAAGSFQTLVTAVKSAELVETLKGRGPFTVFAPSDAAFAKLPKGTVEGLLKDQKKLQSILTYHVVPGRMMAKDVLASKWLKTAQGQSLRVSSNDDGAWIDGAKIVTTDIACSNGVIHVLDTVVMPRPDIVETAIANGSFTTLVAALKSAELVKTLQGEGPFTVFAPTDAAFAKLPAGTVEGLLKDREKLAKILTYHVVAGRVLSSDLPEKLSAKTVQGGEIAIARTKEGKVTVNGAQVVTSDIIVGNGVIHVIDTVILPR